MRKILFLVVISLPIYSFSQAISGDEFITRRAKVLTMLDTSSALVMKSINYTSLGLDYIQEHNFYYLTGINLPSCILVIAPKGIKVGKQIKSTIIFTLSNEDENIVLGKSDTILKYSDFKSIFASIAPSLKKLYFSAPDLILVNDWLNDKAYFMEREMKNGLKAKYPNLKLESAEFLIGKQREIKSPLEISYIQNASNITADGLISAMKIAKPGVFEYEIQAVIEYEYTRQGAMLRGFPSIVGSGLNNLILHYDKNSRQTEAGDLVVLDVGAKYQGYSTDITRTIPISGKYSDAQKEIYEMVLKVQKDAIALCKPGLKLSDLEKFPRDAFKKLGYDKFYMHGLLHQVGLDVHDVAISDVLKPGMVLTIEPGLYFPKDDNNIPEKFRGFGIRIEDTILITETGCEVLTKNAPKEIDEIEKLMKRKR